MRIVTDVNDIRTFWIEESGATNGIVILFPVTRTGPQAISKWKKLVKFVCENSIHSLVVIDKTEGSSAYEFFWHDKSLAATLTNLYVLKRTLNESHYDSLGGVFLPKNLWVIQFHDDDDWDGKIEIPSNSSLREVILLGCYVTGKLGAPEEAKDLSIPARILFSLVPATLWNKFSQLILDQERHTAGSLDSTLSLMATLSCTFSSITSFNYYYDDRNWRSDLESKKHLTRLAEKDGWDTWASPEIAVINRSLDALAALSYCSDFASPQALEAKRTEILNSMKPSFNGRVRSRVKFLTRINFNFAKARNGISLSTVIRKSWKLNSLSELAPFIEENFEVAAFPELDSRFRYWKKVFAQQGLQSYSEEI